MRWTLRAKFLAISTVAGLTFAGLLLVGAITDERILEQLDAIRSRHVPLLKLGPALTRGFEALPRAFQDAVSAHDVEALAATETIKQRLLAQLDQARSIVDPALVARARAAVERYHASAHDVSRRMVAGEAGEPLVQALEVMQRDQQAAAEAMTEAARFDAGALAAAFGETSQNVSTAVRLRFVLSIACMVILLGATLVSMRGVLASVRAFASGLERFGRGDFSAPITVTGDDEFHELADRANAMAADLDRLAQERQDAAWVQRGRVGLAQVLGVDRDVPGLCRAVLDFLVGYLEAPTGVLYVAGEGGSLVAGARFAGEGASDAEAPTFASGEGLVGEAARRREPWFVEHVPEGYSSIRSGTGRATPGCIAFAPLWHLDRNLGVLELGFFRALDAPARELVALTAESVAIALAGASARTRTKSLLEKTREQAERLASQEEELRASNEELRAQQRNLELANVELEDRTDELRAQQRALETSNEDLRRAREAVEAKAKELERVSAYKSQFLANMSHELRTPLNSMLLLSNLMADNEDGNLTPRQVGFCRTIHAAGNDLLELINQVLDLAKVEAGRYELHPESFDLASLVSRLGAMFEPLARDKKLVLEVGLADDVPGSIVSDRRRIEQILTNLLGNAIKFTDRGSVTLRVRRLASGDRVRRSELDSGAAIVFEVRDTGAGIAPEHQELVFAPFEQVEGASDRRHGGTGLGLSIARELAQLLGGELQLESVAGQGSIFRCFLPTSPRSGDTAPEPPSAAIVAPLVEPGAAMAEANVSDDRDSLQPGDPHILVIEDDRAFAEVVGDVVREQAFGFTTSATATEGLDLARRLRPHGILLDVRLPDLDGFQVLAVLRADDRTKHIPVHVMSAFDGAARALASGAVGYLHKPASRTDLLRVVETLVPRQASQSARVLVVEDDAADAASMVDGLQSERHRARAVTTGHEALVALETETFDCLVLDLGLPDMDGLELLTRLGSRDGERPSIVVYTGRPLTREEARRLEEYTDAIVFKGEAGLQRVLDEVRLFTRSLRRAPVERAITPFQDLRLEGRRILLTDDDMRTVYALSALLRAKGAEVLTADTGKAALEVLARAPDVDVVLMDIMMPEMDGYEAIRRIRQEARFARLPIVALTAKAMKGDRERCLEAGADEYLPKPVDPKQLATVLDQLFTRGKAA